MLKNDFYGFVPIDTLREILTTQPTPVYIYFSKIIESKFHALLSALPPRFKIHYAIKANPHPTIISRLRELGAGADVASAGELNVALSCGILPENIEFSGPGKTRAELACAIQAGIGSINIESIGEIETIITLCSELHARARIGMRINQWKGLLKGGLNMSGQTQFGVPESDILPALELIRKSSNYLDFTGIHVHAGSQILSTDAICHNFAAILERAAMIENIGIVGIRKINFGGGWGIPYFAGQRALDIFYLREYLNELFSQPLYRQLLAHTKLIIEPGRFLVAECGIYATRVLYTKTNNTKKFIIVDGGMHHNYLLAGGMGQVIRRNFEMAFIMNNTLGTDLSTFTVAGCLCTPQDILASDVACPRTIGPGDYIVFFNAGAYAYSASPLNFLSHPLPREIFIPSN